MPEMTETNSPIRYPITATLPPQSPPSAYTPSSPSSPPVLPPSAPLTDEPPPPPYTTAPSLQVSAAASASAPNPGFCILAFSERHANRTPGGGMTAAQYFAPCPACGTVVNDEIPGTYKESWREWVDPSVNFRWESHVAPSANAARENAEKVKAGEELVSVERLACWICWEYEERWVGLMAPEEWYLHQRRHFKDEGFRVCVGKTGGMQRRRNCMVKNCPKIHS
ncbi:hypothetical protein HYFRA_00001486 [Hymenoscyphus fraxineus]|uniref:Uncharacterized protein n=1 Tax=Hymenoscyphus fraxineus TaxID=746836 RepID=A0A9N9PMF7_9HELO|nr:hypothetical protein HYFRA_00001486 [Hymenoscyphus fraxineus]